MKTYTKTYSELSSEELISFLVWVDEDYYMQEVLEKIEESKNLNVQVAFALNDDDEITAVDYRIFDPMHICYNDYIYADGWSNWFFENYDEDEEVDEEAILTNRQERQDFRLGQFDIIETKPVCVSEGQKAPWKYAIIDECHCIGDDGTVYQLIDRDAINNSKNI